MEPFLKKYNSQRLKYHRKVSSIVTTSNYTTKTCYYFEFQMAVIAAKKCFDSFS